MTPRLLFILCLLICMACKKKTRTPADKNITAFVLRASENPVLTTDLQGVIDGDTIRLSLSQTIASNLFKPTIIHQGVGISPAPGVQQHFSGSLVTYIVTAADGSTKRYVVKTTVLSNAKAITLFKIRAADNPSVIGNDITAIIRNDSIIFYSAVVDNIKPYIEFQGKTVSPGSGSANDFSTNRQYQVTAEDGTARLYTVVASKNRTVYFGSGDGYLYALNAADGSIIWKTKTGNFMNGAPDYSNGFVYAPSTNGIYCVNAGTGAIAWNNSLPGGNVGTTPFVDGNMVYATNGGYGTYWGLHAMNATTGAVVWSKHVISGFITSPTVWNNSVIAGDVSAGMCALDKTTGATQWIKTEGLIRTTPRVRNNNAYFSGELMHLYEVDATTGVVKRTYHDGSQNTANYGLCFYNGSIYISTYNSLIAIDSATLAFKWRYTTISNGNNSLGTLSAPVAANGMVYFGSDESFMYAVDANTGLLKWKTGNPISPSVGGPSNVTVANGVVFCGNYTGKLIAYDALTGVEKWSYQTASSAYAGAVVVDAGGNIHYPGSSGHH